MNPRITAPIYNAQSVINDGDDAVEHWRSNAGGRMPAGSALLSLIEKRAEKKFSKSILCNDSSASCSRPKGELGYFKFFDFAVGSVTFKVPSYPVTLSISDAAFGFRKIELTATRTLNFEFNHSLCKLKTRFTDSVPSVIAGQGLTFSIYGTFNQTLEGSFRICCWGY